MRVKKRVFISLVALVLLTVMTLLGLVVSFSWWEGFGRLLVLVVFLGLSGAILFAGIGLLAIVYMIETGKDMRIRFPMRFMVDILYPVTIRVGKLFGVPREKVQNSFVEVNNALVKTSASDLAPEKVLVLIPHCMQWVQCNHKITADIHNCRRCGKCQIAGMLDLTEEYGVDLTVATGGGMARRIIQEFRPEAVVAVACERDLTSGLQETFPLPVFGVVNLRPEGYCVNTRVKMDDIRAALELFVHGRPSKLIDIQQVAVSKN